MGAPNEKVRVIYKKKKGGGHGHHGGAWKVAYADFVTAMMALFMVLWLLTQADMELRAAIARYFRDPGILHGGSGISEVVQLNSVTPAMVTETEHLARKSEEQVLQAQAKEVQILVDKLSKSGNAELGQLGNQVQVKVTERGLLVDVVDTEGRLLFDVSSANLSPTLVKFLEELSKKLGELPNGIEIGGHTDALPFVGTDRNNWDLSYQRASAARNIMEKSGLRIRQVKEITAHADSQLLVPENPLDPKNRRLSILLTRRGPPPSVEPPAKKGRWTGGGELGVGGSQPKPTPPPPAPAAPPLDKLGDRLLESAPYRGDGKPELPAPTESAPPSGR